MGKLRSIIELGDKRLRVKSKAVSFPLKKSDKALIKDLIKTCKEKDGVGIAAPQLGINKRIFIIWSRPTKRYKEIESFGPIALINPIIRSTSKRKINGIEGCLSIPGLRGRVSRFQNIQTEYRNEKGERIKTIFKDFIARIFQHEFDHLEGVVFLDRVKPKDLMTEAEYKKLIKTKK